MTVALTVAEAERRVTAVVVRFYPDGQSSGGEIVQGSMAALAHCGELAHRRTTLSR